MVQAILKLRYFVVFCLACTLLSLTFGSRSFANSVDLDALYRKGQRSFLKKNYRAALPLLEKYLNDSAGKKYKRERLFWVIDQIGRIHLRVNRNPNAALKFFGDIVKNEDRLSEAERDDIGAWISAAKDWKKNLQPLGRIADEKKKFKSGVLYFQKGKKKLKFPADDAGNAYFTLTSMYLIPFINNNDRSPDLGKALLMMGEVRIHLRTDPEYWNENFYLKEAIRRFPNSKIALDAYSMLATDVKIGYTGSSGEIIPPSITTMLKVYEKLASPPTKNSSSTKKPKPPRKKN